MFELLNSLWLYCLKYLSELETRPTQWEDTIFERLFETAEINKLTKKEMGNYKKNLADSWDVQLMMKCNREEGREEGLKEGREEGMLYEKLQMVQKLIEMNLSVGEIIKITGLTEEQIKGIK